MPATLLYWIAFIAYSLLVIGVGYAIWWKEKRLGKAADNQLYWAANKNLSGWAAGLSISASMMSISWSCVYGVQLFYWYGIGGAWLLIVPWLITMLGFYIFTPLFRKLQAYSQPELLEKRFGTGSRQFLAPALIFVFIVWAGAEIYAAGIIIAPFLSISVPLTLFLIALVVALYSFSGGFEVVVSTDKIQFALVALFITLIAIVGYRAVDQAGQVSKLLSATTIAPKLMNGKPWYFSPGAALILMTFFAYLPGWLVETDVWIRLQAARSNREARKGILVTSINSLIFVGMLPMIIGLAALVLYPPLQGVIPSRLQDGALILNVIMQDYTPLWLNILLGIGLIAAAMSTVDTCGNVVALSISYDLLEPHFQHRWSARQLNRLARWFSVVAIFTAFVYALFTKSLRDIFYLSSGVLTTTVVLPVLAAFWRKTTARQVNLAIVAGFVGTFIFYFLEKHGYLQPIEPREIAQTGLGYILWGFLCCLTGFFLGRQMSE